MGYAPSLVDGFDQWWQTYGQPYEAAVIANGDEPWTDSLDERRALWDRRYTRPHPPQGLHTELDDIRRPDTAWTPILSRAEARAVAA